MAVHRLQLLRVHLHRCLHYDSPWDQLATINIFSFINIFYKSTPPGQGRGRAWGNCFIKLLIPYPATAIEMFSSCLIFLKVMYKYLFS